MRVSLSLGVALATLLFAASSVSAGTMAERDGWVMHDTPHAFGDLVSRLNEAIKGEKMRAVTRASASAGARNQGITIPGNMVVGVYRNDFARRMLEASIAAGIEAPIRYYLTENPDGTTSLAYKTPSAVFGPYMDEGGDALKALASELDAMFATIAEKAMN